MAAMFFDFPVNSPVPYRPIDCAWHSKTPLLAVASSTTRQGIESGLVCVFNEDGENMTSSETHRSALPVAVAWHPTEPMLISAWSGGELLLWSEQTGGATECKLHDASITTVVWSPDGSRVVTADESGRVGVWKPSKGRLTLVCEYARKGEITKCVFKETAHNDCIFFLATSNREVLLCNANKQCEVAFTVDSGIYELLYNSEDDSVVVVTTNMMLVMYSVAENGAVSNQREFKLSGKAITAAAWALPGVLVAATGENMIRVLDLENSENYTLSLAREKGEFNSSDVLQSLAFDSRSNTLAAVSRNGFVFLWKYKGAAADKLEAEQKWTFLTPTELSGSLVKLQWGGNNNLAVMNDKDAVSILREHSMRKAFGKNTAAVQVSASRIVVDVFGKATNELDTDFTIKGIDAWGDVVVVWSGQNVAVYELVKDFTILRHVGTFKCDAQLCAIGPQTIYTTHRNKIHARNLQGASKQEITLEDGEGDVALLDCNGNFLVVATNNGYIRAFDLSRREARAHGVSKNVTDDLDAISDIKISADGAKVSFLGVVDGSADPSVWVWDVESDQVHTQAFGVGSRVPIAQFWDPEDPRLFAVETTIKGSDSFENQITTLFATPSEGVLKQHSTNLTAADGPLIGIQVPNIFTARRGKGDDGHIVEARPMRDFVGLDKADEETKKAMLEFSYQLTVGNMDEAFRAVRLIKSEGVWENMARMCVTTKRLDVAAVCMGNMGNALGARALRAASKEPQVEARVAMLAVQLGMYKEAEALYKECGRYDLLNRLHQDRGQWPDALNLAKTKDRVHLRNTYFAYAKHLEALGKIDEATEYYELSETHRFEIPRLLFNEPEKLEAYVKQSKNKDLLKWWAQYLESSHEMEEALKFYAAADDTLSLVRVYCYCENVDNARELVDKTGDRAAAYHLARHYENQDNFEDAIKYFSLSECYNNAIRLAKEHGLKHEMVGLALKSSKADMIAAAEFYEQQGMIDKAVTLYHKGGRIAKALELCFANSLYQALAEVSEDLDQDADPELLERAANFFIENKQHAKAVNLLIVAKKLDEALAMCEEYNVPVTEDMAEKLTLPKGEGENDDVRNALLERVADLCHSQGSYQLATKKFTQAGQLIKAMRALLKCGDTEKIIYFAGKCRTKEIYVMAANYLQSLDWRHDHEIMKNIINFYTKGKALESLSSFYDACAQVEIDDYQNYDKALGALNEALKCMSKAKMKDLNEQEVRVSSLQTRISLVQKFCDIKQMADEAPQEMVQEARRLLQEPEVDTAVRIGDVFGLMIERLAALEQHQAAYSLMQEMRQRIPNVNEAYYVNIRTIEAVHRALDIPLGRGHGADQGGEDYVGEDIRAK